MKPSPFMPDVRLCGVRWLLAFTVVLMAALPSQAQRWSWLTYTNGSGDEFGQRTGVDAAGNVYVAGVFSGTTTFGNNVGSPSITSAGANDVFIAKYNAAGTVQWAVRAGGTASEGMQDMAVDAAGNIYILSTYYSAGALFGATSLTNTSGGVFGDVAVAKLNTNGAWQWAVKCGGTSDDSGASIALDASGSSVYIGGSFQGTATFGATSQVSNGNYDGFIAKLNASGAWQWSQKTGSTGSDGIRALATDATGNVYMAGYFSAPMTLGALPLANASGTSDVFVARISAIASWNWAVRAGGTGLEQPTDIALDAAANVYLTGTFTSTNAVFGATTLVTNGGTDVFVARLNPTSAWAWATKVGGTGTDGSTGLAVDGMGDVHVTGYFSSPSLVVGPHTLTGTGGTESLMMSFTASAGVGLWAGKGLFGPANEYLYGLCVDAAGVLYVAGGFNSNPYTLGNGNGVLGELPGNTAPGGGYNMFFGKVWAPPVVTSISQASGPVGMSLVLTGSNLSGVTSVFINGAVSTAISASTATGFTVAVPAGANMNVRTQTIRINSPTGGTNFSLPKFTVTGAVTLLADSVTALPGTIITLPVRVKGFTNMAALQGTLLYDATKLTFVGVTQFGLTGMNATNFNTDNAGQLPFAWNNPTNAATTVPDNTAAFTVKFIVGAVTPGSVLAFDFANAPVPVLVMQSNFVAATFVTKSGKGQVPATTATLTGTAATKIGTLLPGVVMTCAPLGAAQAVTTTANGQFSFANLVATGTYSLIPSKTNDVSPNNGLSVIDLALMQRHILGVALLNDAYNVVAADVDRSGAVTVADVALTRSVLIGSSLAFPKGRRWVFVRANQTFVNLNSPWPIDTFRTYPNLATATAQDFVGCKLGDVDNSWNAAIPRPAPGLTSIDLAIGSAHVQPGQRFTVPIQSTGGFRQLSALQLTAAWDATALRLVAVTDGALPGVVYNLSAAADGRLPLLWSDAGGASQSRPAGAVLAYLTFEALPGFSAATALTIAPDYGSTGDATALPARFYDDALTLQPLNLIAGIISPTPLGLASGLAATTLQLTPNPAHETVHISGAPGTDAHLFDALGRALQTVRLTDGGGTLDVRGLPAGVYFVRVAGGMRRLVVE